MPHQRRDQYVSFKYICEYLVEVGVGGRFTNVNVSENNVAAWVTLELL